MRSFFSLFQSAHNDKEIKCEDPHNEIKKLKAWIANFKIEYPQIFAKIFSQPKSGDFHSIDIKDFNKDNQKPSDYKSFTSTPLMSDQGDSKSTPINSNLMISNIIETEIKEVESFLYSQKLKSNFCTVATVATFSIAGGLIGAASGILIIPAIMPIVAIGCGISSMVCAVPFLLDDCIHRQDRGYTDCIFSSFNWLKDQGPSLCNFCSLPWICGPWKDCTALYATTITIGGTAGCITGGAVGYNQKDDWYKYCCSPEEENIQDKQDLKIQLHELKEKFSQLMKLLVDYFHFNENDALQFLFSDAISVEERISSGPRRQA